jgi:hypothetical protein
VSARTIAEIINLPDPDMPHRYPMSGDDDGDYIAWRCAACGEWIRENDPRTRCTVVWRNLQPTVDDLLAWLHVRTADLHISVSEQFDPEPIHWRVVWDDIFSEPHRTEARTLLAALEAAVRVVAGVSGDAP